ncbi:hypothetical protein ACMWQD_29995, partial [Escherichia coli]|uniref:hypothetical protein n=1 Tax=Escherichia coli TaxID=562 RepID=UPI0039E130E6
LTGGPNSQGGTHQIIVDSLTTSQQQSLGRLFVDTVYDFPAQANWGFPGDATVDGQAGSGAAGLKRSLQA